MSRKVKGQPRVYARKRHGNDSNRSRTNGR